jgi:hypothetical protein
MSPQEQSAKLMTQLPGKLIDAKACAMRADDEASVRAVYPMTVIEASMPLASCRAELLRGPLAG